MAKHNGNDKSSSGTVKAPTTSAAERTPNLPGIMVDGTTRDVPVGQVRIVPGWNMRTVTVDEKVRDLAESIRLNGQLQECVVTPERDDAGNVVPDSYLLVAGERRMLAIRDVLNAPTVRVRIMPTRTVGAMFAENADREQPTPADSCRLVKRLRDEKLTNTAIAALLRLSTQTTSNLYSIATKLAPDVWAEWSARSDEDGAMRFALEWYARTHDEQRKAWGEWKARRAAGEPAPKRNKSSGGSAGAEGDGGDVVAFSRKEMVALAHRLHLAIDAGTDDESTCETWLECLKYILTQRTSDASNRVSGMCSAAESKRTKMGAKGEYRDAALDAYLNGKDIKATANEENADGVAENEANAVAE